MSMYTGTVKSQAITWFFTVKGRNPNCTTIHYILDLYFLVLERSFLCSQIVIRPSTATEISDVNSLIARYCPFNSANHFCCSVPFSLFGFSPWCRQMEGPPANPDSQVLSACSGELSAKVNTNTRHHRTMCASHQGCASLPHLRRHTQTQRKKLPSTSKDVALDDKWRHHP